MYFPIIKIEIKFFFKISFSLFYNLAILSSRDRTKQYLTSENQIFDQIFVDELNKIKFFQIFSNIKLSDLIFNFAVCPIYFLLHFCYSSPKFSSFTLIFVEILSWYYCFSSPKSFSPPKRNFRPALQLIKKLI